MELLVFFALLVAALVPFVLSLKLSSPIVVPATFLLLLAPLRIDDDNFYLGVSITLGWVLVLLILIFLLSKAGVAMSKFSLVYKINPSSWRKLLYLTILMVVSAVWVQQLGISTLAGDHEREVGDFSNVVSTIFRSFVTFATIILIFAARKNPYKWLAILTFLLVFIGGYLINKRGVIFWPLVNLFLLYLVRDYLSFVFSRKIVFSAVLIFAAFFVIVEMTAQRGNTSRADALENIFNTLSGDKGNGVSPNMDADVIVYTERNGVLLHPVNLLSGFYGLIPRALWEEKPAVGIGRIIGYFVFQTGNGDVNTGAGTPVSMPAQMVATYGAPAYIFGLCFFVLLFYWLFRLSKTYPVMLLPAINAAVWLMGSDIGRVQVSFLVSLITTYLLMRFFGVTLVHNK